MNTSRGRLILLTLAAVLGLSAWHAISGQEQTLNLIPPTDLFASDLGWPRTLDSNGTKVTIYQPQIESWQGNKLTARAAVALQNQAAATPTYGVVHYTARTDVDRELRLVFLSDLKAARLDLPSVPDKAKDYLATLQASMPDGMQSISLDRVEANLAVTQAENQTQKVPLKNDPPEIIFSTKPAILVLIDGKPALRQIGTTGLLRIINTRDLIVLDENAGNYYLHFMDKWLTAKSLDGAWAVAQNPPAALANVMTALTGSKQPIDLLDDPAPDLKDQIDKGTWPVVYVRTAPADLIETRGDPQMSPIDGTQLLWVTNTSSQVLLDTKNDLYYVLLSGRWFSAKKLTGPWAFVPADKIPPDVAKIPETHPKGDVLAAVPGTPQAQQANIANQIPQTATVKRSEAQLTTLYDGDPKFEPIADTNLSYAVNSPTPVVLVNPNSFYAVENGVWFNSAAATGPWAVADSVPAAIYTIPPSSPIYNVTYVQVYGSTPDVVYCGYTPGYYGTCFAPWGCVVYGTGWVYPPWIGNYWFGRCWSYGFDVGFRWTPWGGWCFGFGAAVGRPWWGPLGWHGGYGGVWRDGWHGGWGGRYDNVHLNHVNVNNFNLYNRWHPKATVNDVHRTAVNLNRKTTFTTNRINANNVFAGRDEQVLRRTGNTWETLRGNDWRNFTSDTLPAERRSEFENINRNLNTEWNARRLGESNHYSFDTGSRFGGISGYHGGYSGFRGIGLGGAHFGGFHYGGFRGGFRR